MIKYTLTVTEEQACTISAALDFYARVGCGQFQVIDEMFRFTSPTYDADEAQRAILTLKHLLLVKECGIAEAPARFRTAWDIHQVIRHRVSWDRQPSGGFTVNFDEPLPVNPDEPLATIQEAV